MHLLHIDRWIFFYNIYIIQYFYTLLSTLDRHQKSMHCIYTQILWLFNALYRLRGCQRLLLFSVTVTEAARFVSVNPRRCFQPIKILQFYWCYFVIGPGILQPLLELLNTEPRLRLLLINTQIVKMSHAVFTYILIGWARQTFGWA